jgi:hypothetical protein
MYAEDSRQLRKRLLRAILLVPADQNDVLSYAWPAFSFENDTCGGQVKSAEQRERACQFHGSDFIASTHVVFRSSVQCKYPVVTRLVLLAALVSPVFAGEYAVLHTGFRIYADRHEMVGDTTRLHTETGTMDVPSANVARFEVEEYVKPVPPPPPVQPAPTPVQARVPPPPTPQELLEQAASTHGLRPEFVRSVASVESAFRAEAVSPKGAIGLMQLMPGTAKDLGADPRNPAENAEAGARYLKQLLLRYANTPDPVRLALAAYNAGPGAVDKYGRIPPYRETQAYVEKVLRKYLAEVKSGRS